MTSDRPYRKGMPRDKAFAIIKEVSGTKLDPELVPIFLKIANEIHDAKAEVQATFVYACIARAVVAFQAQVP